MPEKDRSVVNLFTSVAQALGMAKSAVKRERKMAESKTFALSVRHQNVY